MTDIISKVQAYNEARTKTASISSLWGAAKNTFKGLKPAPQWTGMVPPSAQRGGQAIPWSAPPVLRKPTVRPLIWGGVGAMGAYGGGRLHQGFNDKRKAQNLLTDLTNRTNNLDFASKASLMFNGAFGRRDAFNKNLYDNYNPIFKRYGLNM